MPTYKVRSGQNIYDVALTLHGSVEGIFDLLISNDWLTMDTTLSRGMELNYHEEFAINKNISLWLSENKVLVRNGEHACNHLDIESLIVQHMQEKHPDVYEATGGMSPDERDMLWETLCTPRMVIHQQGQLATLKIKMKPDRHLVIDWGDCSEPLIVDEPTEQELEHCYKGLGPHIITFFGDFEFELLDLAEANGVHYPLGTIKADTFVSSLENKDLNKLIITQ